MLRLFAVAWVALSLLAATTVATAQRHGRSGPVTQRMMSAVEIRVVQEQISLYRSFLHAMKELASD